MPKNKLQAMICSDIVRLSREQWKGHEAQISNYPGLLDVVKNYTWTYVDNGHPYLHCSKLNMYLHKFVLVQLYGEERLNEMLSAGSIIEHLDNNGLNCSYDNLHVLSEDYNKAKAFTIDKAGEIDGIPIYIYDVYYSHKYSRYQMQIVFNKDIYFSNIYKTPIERFYCQYTDFRDLYLDWLYIINCRDAGVFDIRKFHNARIHVKLRPRLVLTDEEKDNVIIERNGELYLVLRTDAPNSTFINHTAYQEIDS